MFLKGRRVKVMGALISNDSELDTLISLSEVETLVLETFKAEGLTCDAEVSIAFVDNDEIHELNREWRGIDKPTDVLSFECDDPFDASIGADDTIELGDVILAPAVIAAQAPQFNTTPADEMRLMLVHGLMHLFGYDHMTEEDALEMEAHERFVLQRGAVLRGADPSSVVIGPTTRHIDD